MKKSIFTFIAIMLTSLLGTAAEFDSSTRSYDYNGNAYIFIEGPIEFSVFPDGQFDFVYLGYDNRGRVNVNINPGNVNINYNAGFNYEPYLQYDDYGAVIQIEDIPIFYDQFGRITRAGNTNIIYNDRRIVRVGGMRIFYHPWGGFNYYTGFINVWTPRYIWRPWHVFYMRPYYSNCIVYDLPYRRYYNPHRYPYWRHRQLYNNHRRVAYNNGRRNFYNPGSRIHHRDGRTVKNRDYSSSRRNPIAASNPRRADKGINQNMNRIARSTGRNDKSVSKRRVSTRKSNAVARNNSMRSSAASRPSSELNRRTRKSDRVSAKGNTVQRNTPSRAYSRPKSAAKPKSRSAYRPASRPKASSKSYSTARSTPKRARISSGNRQTNRSGSPVRSSNRSSRRGM